MQRRIGDKSFLLNLLANRTSRMRSSEIRELLKLITSEIISFAGGIPDPKSFPSDEQLREAFEYAIENKADSLQYGITDGLPSFRRELLKFIERNMGIKGDLENIIITIGSQQALDVISRVFIDQRDKIAVGLPTYLAALQAFNIWRPHYIGVPEEFDGMKVDILEEEVKKYYHSSKPIKFVYTIPTGHNPTGSIMSLDKRKYLLELASRYDFFIVEDDPYGFITFNEDIPPRLKALDDEGRVIYTSTFSKIFAPGVRTGWILADKDAIRYMSLSLQAMNVCPPNFTQYILEYFLKKRYIDENIKKIRILYKAKRDAMLEALDENMPDNVEWSRPKAGFFIFVILPEYINTKTMLYEALNKAKVAYVPGVGFYFNGSGWNTMRLSYSLPSPDVIRIGIERLAKLVKKKIEESKS